MKNKSGKRKAESGNFPPRATGGAGASFPLPDFSLCYRRPAGSFSFHVPLSAFRCRPVCGFSFRFPLSAFRFCL
jgi:hypothetical protein